jgi:hypothetical protein
MSIIESARQFPLIDSTRVPIDTVLDGVDLVAYTFTAPRGSQAGCASGEPNQPIFQSSWQARLRLRLVFKLPIHLFLTLFCAAQRFLCASAIRLRVSGLSVRFFLARVFPAFPLAPSVDVPSERIVRTCFNRAISRSTERSISETSIRLF